MTCACGCGQQLSGRHARGLTMACYSRARRAGTLPDFPRPTRSYAETAEDATILHTRGVDLDGIAERLGLRPGSVVRAVERRRAQLEQPSPELDRVLVELRHQALVQRWATITDEQRARKAQRRRVRERTAA